MKRAYKITVEPVSRLDYQTAFDVIVSKTFAVIFRETSKKTRSPIVVHHSVLYMQILEQMIVAGANLSVPFCNRQYRLPGVLNHSRFDS